MVCATCDRVDYLTCGASDARIAQQSLQTRGDVVPRVSRGTPRYNAAEHISRIARNMRRRLVIGGNPTSGKPSCGAGVAPATQ